MRVSVGYSIVFCFVLMAVKEAFGQMQPSNAVTEIGGEIIFNCSGTSFQPNWFRAKDGTIANQVPIAGGGCVVGASLRNHYWTEQTAEPNSCNLIVFNVTMNEAGVYWCVDSMPSFALLTVLDSPPNVTYNNTPDVVEGERVVITCTLNYSGSVEPAPTLRPHFYWMNYTGNNVSNFMEMPPDNSSVVSHLTVTAGRQNIMPYTCHVYLQLVPTGRDNYAVNTPSVNSYARSEVIVVFYYPRIMNITSSISSTDKCVYKPENLTCAADANPSAHYEWRNLSGSVMTLDSVMSITSGGQFECIAYNTIRLQRHDDKQNTSEVNCYSPYNVTITGSNCQNNLCACSGNQSSIFLNCTADGFPEPIYQWQSDPGQEKVSSKSIFEVNFNGNYSCTASNIYGSQTHNATAYVSVTNCTHGPNLCYLFLLLLIFPVFGGAAGIGFALYYGGEQMNIAFNNHFPFLQRMLPCMNDNADATTFERFGWIFLYILMSITVGIVMIPYMLIKVNCCKKKDNEENEATPSGAIAKDKPPEEMEKKRKRKKNTAHIDN